MENEKFDFHSEISKSQNEWVDFHTIDFNDKSILKVSIDTRDFHAIITRNPEKVAPQTFVIPEKKAKNFYHTPEEVMTLITRLFTESGGDRDWRMLYLCGEGKRWTSAWQLKYIRLFNTERGYLVCGRQYNNPFPKNILQYKVDNNGY